MMEWSIIGRNNTARDTHLRFEKIEKFESQEIRSEVTYIYK